MPLQFWQEWPSGGGRLEGISSLAAMTNPNHLAGSPSHHRGQRIYAIDNATQVVLWRVVEKADLHINNNDDIDGHVVLA